MSSPLAQRGGETVGMLAQRSPAEIAVIRALRLWCDGADGQHDLRQEFSAGLVSDDAARTFTNFDACVRLILRYASRNLVRNDVNSSYISADEAIFANLISTATSGHLQDASLIATLLCGPAQAERIALLAGEVGQSVKRLTQHANVIQPETHQVLARLH